MEDSVADPKARGLGLLSVLPDEVINYVLRSLDAKTLTILGCASKALRIFCMEEPLWQELHLSRCRLPFEFKGSWRATYLACAPECGMPSCTAASLLQPPQVPGFASMFLYKRWYRGHVDLSGFLPQVETIPRADGKALTAAQFEARFDGPSQPVLLGGLAEDWNVESWTPSSLAASLGSRQFKATKPSGGKLRMALDAYLAYSSTQHDEEPVYIFDADFGETAPELLAAYKVPPIFAHDLFSPLGYARDEYRWLVAGPPRSGANWHVDPAATSAWNTSLVGRKRWALYPPGKVPPGVMVHVHPSGDPDFRSPTSLQWFLEVYPHLPPEERPLEVVQNPGETIFLPAGWWHCVLNLDMTVAVTQNFVSPANLESVVQYLALGAGSVFDPGLVPAYLHMRRERQGAAEQLADNRAVQLESKGGGAAMDSKEEPLAPHAPAALPSSGSPASSSSGLSGSSGNPSTVSKSSLVTAASHLRHAVLGFERGGPLGRWLRALVPWPERSIAQRAAELGEVYTDVAEWRGRVEAVCLEAGLPPPLPHEVYPLSGGEALVFQVGNLMLKFFHTRFFPAGHAMWQVEAAAYHSMGAAEAAAEGAADAVSAANGGQAGRRRVGSSLPRLLRCGVLQDEPAAAPLLELSDTACTAGAQAGQQRGSGGSGWPYLLVSKAPGATLGSCMEWLQEEQWLEVAAAAGQALASFHALPLPQAPMAAATAAARPQCTCGGQPASNGCSAAAARGEGGAACTAPQGAAQQLPAATAWTSHSSHVWSSLHGAIDKRAWLALQVGQAPNAQSPATVAAARAGEDGAVPEVQQQQQHLEGDALNLAKSAADSQQAGGRPAAGRDLLSQLTLFPLLPRLRARAPAGGPQVGAIEEGEVAVEVEEAPSVPAAKRARLGPANKSTLGAADATGCDQPKPAMPPAWGGQGSCAGSTAAAAAWLPFVSFLRYRRRKAVRGSLQHVLPPHLFQQLGDYLPEDPAVLLGVPQLLHLLPEGMSTSPSAGAPISTAKQQQQEGPAALPLPSWLHGDLTAENLLLNPPPVPAQRPRPGISAAGEAPPVDGGAGAAAVNGRSESGRAGGRGLEGVLIDFADGGHGDPLWDLIPLYLRSLRCKQGALRSCLSAYAQLEQQQLQQSNAPARLPMLRPRYAAIRPLAAAAEPEGAAAATPSAAGIVQAVARCSPAEASTSQQHQQQQQQQQQQRLPLSYVATCYMLLHELDVVEEAMRKLPQLGEVPSLEQLQRELWGALDEAGEA